MLAAMGCPTLLGSIMVALATLAAGAGAEGTMPTEDVLVCSAKTLSSGDYSRFQANVGAVIEEIKSNVVNSDVYAGSTMYGEPMAYVQVMCDEAAPQAECVACFESLSVQIQQRCPNAAGARAKEGRCFLRCETFLFT